MTKNTLFAPLALPRFRKLFFAQLLSDFGSWLEFIALTILITFRWELGASALAAYFLAVCLPYVLFGPILGVLADRFDRKRVMMIADLLRALLLVALIFAPNLQILLLLVFCKGALSTWFNSARQSTIRLIVPEEQLLQASSLSQTSVNLSKVIGPTLGATLLASLEMTYLFLIGAAMYTLSAALLSRLPALPREQVTTSAAPSFFGDFRAGLQIIRSKQILLILIAFFAAESLAMFAFEPQGSLLIRSVGFSEQIAAYLISTVGLGSILIAWVLGRFGHRIDPFTTLCLAAVLLGGALIALSVGGFGLLHVSLWSWFPLWFVLGLTIGAIGVNYGFLLQAETPPEYMGRVAGTAESLVYLAILAAALLGGALGEWQGVPTVFLWSGLHMIAVGIWIKWISRRRSLAIGKNTPTSIG